MKKLMIIPVLAFLAAGCNATPATTPPPPPPAAQTLPPAPPAVTLKITSPAFAENTPIPEKYTCDVKEVVSVPLNFSNVPAKAQSLALIMDDPDVPITLIPNGLFVHWVVFNMPATTTALAEGMTPPGLQGKNGSGKAVYAGPCPPDRQHRYFFKLYALDTTLNLQAGATKDELEDAMKGHIIEQAQLIGLFNKKGNPQ